MKLRHLILTSVMLIMSIMYCSATTHIVDSHYPRPAGVYATIQLAYDAASPGDTILISPAPGEYAGITVAKRIHIVGTGWGDASATIVHTKTSSFIFNPGAQGSTLTGLEINNNVDINADSITVKRNKLQFIFVRANSSNIVIIQNYIIGSRAVNWEHWSNGSIISIFENTEVFISNNIIINQRTDYENYCIMTNYPTNVIICNNVLKSEQTVISVGTSGGNYSSHSVFNNIIFWGGGTSGVATTYTENNHNIGNSTQFGTINNNQQNLTMSNVFVDPATYNFHLIEGSPAAGAGLDGTDCGIYGGLYPFVDNGRTWLPIITEMTVPPLVNIADGLDISVKAKSGK